MGNTNDFKNLDLKKFTENVKNNKKAKEDLIRFMGELVDVGGAKDKLVANGDIFIYNALITLNLEELPFTKYGRLGTLLGFLSQDLLKKYGDFVGGKYSKKEPSKLPTKPEKPTKENTKEYNNAIYQWNKDNKSVFEWNQKLRTLVDYLKSITMVDLYGDIDRDVSNLPYVYFKFLDTDTDEIEIFIQEFRTCPVEVVNRIVSVRIEDITGKFPEFIKSANEVKVFFEKEEDATELAKSINLIGSVYEKYVIKNFTMRKDGGEWGLPENRVDNLSNPIFGALNLNNLQPSNGLNSGDSYEEDPKFHESDYEAQLSDCYWANLEYEEGLFVIVPQEFWDEYTTVLDNPKMKIIGITDEKGWIRDGIFFRYTGEISDAKNYLLSVGAEYLDELEEYNQNKINDVDEDDDSSEDDEDFLKNLEKYYVDGFIWCINRLSDDDYLTVYITPKKYFKEEGCLSDWGALPVEEMVVDGYELGELSESYYELTNSTTGKYVSNVDEIRRVMKRSNFTYSYKMQNFVDEGDHDGGCVDSNDYEDKNDFFRSLQKEMDIIK